MNTDNQLYLGHSVQPGFARHRKIEKDFELDPTDLLTHMFICGQSGFGKTVLGKAVVEEMALQGVPAVVVDLKGDLSSLALPLGRLATDSNAASALRGLLGRSIDRQIAQHLEKREEDRRYAARSERFAREVEVTVLTPKAPANPVSLAAFPAIGKTPKDCEPQERLDYEQLIDASARSFLARLYSGSKSDRKAELTFLRALLQYAWQESQDLEAEDGLRKLVNWIIHPPIEEIGGLPTEIAIPKRSRERLARDVNSELVGAEKAWHLGPPFHLDHLLQARSGRTPIVILNLSHLHEFAEQAFVVAQVCYRIYRWMRTTGGSDRPRLLFFLDEIGGGGGAEAFFPAYPQNPASKGPISLLVKQGRSFGVCSLLATQNVMDVDHRGLANCSTWAIGNLNSERERKRIENTIHDEFAQGGSIIHKMAALKPSHFLVRTKSGRTEELSERWLCSAHLSIPPSLLSQTLACLAADERPTTPAVDPLPAPPLEPTLGASSAREELIDTGEFEQRPWPLPESENAPAEDRPSPKISLEEEADEPAEIRNEIPTSAALGHDAADLPRRDRVEFPYEDEDPDDDEDDVTRTAVAPERAGDEDDDDATQTSARGAVVWRLEDSRGTESWPLEPGRTYSLGRKDYCDITIAHPEISRRHLFLDVTTDEVLVRVDANVKNEPEIDGRLVPRGGTARVQADGSTLALGDRTLTIRREV